MDFEAFEEYRSYTPTREAFEKRLNPIIRELIEEGMRPNTLAMELSRLATAIVLIGEDNETFKGFGTYLNETSQLIEDLADYNDRTERYFSFCPDLKDGIDPESN